MAKKRSNKKDLPQVSYFEDTVDEVIGQLRAIVLATYDRKNTGAFAFGPPGLVTVASELLAQAKNSQGLFNASTFTLSAVLMMVGAYNLERRPAPDVRLAE